MKIGIELRNKIFDFLTNFKRTLARLKMRLVTKIFFQQNPEFCVCNGLDIKAKVTVSFNKGIALKLYQTKQKKTDTPTFWLWGHWVTSFIFSMNAKKFTNYTIVAKYILT